MPAIIPSMVRFCIAGNASPSGSDTGSTPSFLNGSTWIGAPPWVRTFCPWKSATVRTPLCVSSIIGLDAGGEDFDALIGAEGGEAAADRGVVDDLVAVQHVVEQAGRVEHLEARLEAHPETVRRAASFDRAERHAFHHRG